MTDHVVTRVEELGLVALAEKLGLMGTSGPTILAAKWIRTLHGDDVDDLYAATLDAIAARVGDITRNMLFGIKLGELHEELSEIEAMEIAKSLNRRDFDAEPSVHEGFETASIGAASGAEVTTD